MRILDLFCGAGGAAVGYHRAFPDAEIVGVDIAPQPNYPFTFIQGDALAPPVDLDAFDLVHASPPCQSYTPMSNRWSSSKPRLITHVRQLVAGRPYVIENVVGSSRDLNANLMLCGSMFGLSTRRHRLFETSFLVLGMACGSHDGHVPVYGRPDGRRLFGELRAWSSVEAGQKALGIDWTDEWHEIREAIPPAYTEYIGNQMR